jgi:hypothetical protein
MVARADLRLAEAAVPDRPHVAARPLKAGDEVELDRVGGQFDDDRNGRRRCPCRKRRRSCGRGYHGHLALNQISRQCGQPFVFIPGEAIFDSDVLTLDKACVFQTLTERGEELWGVAGRPGVEGGLGAAWSACRRTAWQVRGET